MVYKKYKSSNDMDYKHLKEVLQVFVADDDVRDYPLELDDVITDTARSGVVRFPWDLLKPLLIFKLKKVFDSVFEGQNPDSDEGISKHLLDRLNTFDNPPFTIQRVCELIIEPTKQYKKIGAYMRAVERNLLVVSTQEPDLTWMKSPRLTQLLEERPKTSDKETQNLSVDYDSSKTTSNSHTNTNTTTEETKSESHDQSEDNSDTTNTRNIDSAVANETLGHTVIDQPIDKDELKFNSSLVSRKRPSSELETSRAESPLLPEEETGTVLQEADSTTTGESEHHDETAMDVDNVPCSTDTSKSVNDLSMSSHVQDSEGSDVEASVAKRLKPSSPEESSMAVKDSSSEGREELGEGVVSSLLQMSGSNGQVQNASTGQSEACVDGSEIPSQTTSEQV